MGRRGEDAYTMRLARGELTPDEVIALARRSVRAAVDHLREATEHAYRHHHDPLARRFEKYRELLAGLVKYLDGDWRELDPDYRVRALDVGVMSGTRGYR